MIVEMIGKDFKKRAPTSIEKIGHGNDASLDAGIGSTNLPQGADEELLFDADETLRKIVIKVNKNSSFYKIVKYSNVARANLDCIKFLAVLSINGQGGAIEVVRDRILYADVVAKKGTTDEYDVAGNINTAIGKTNAAMINDAVDRLLKRLHHVTGKFL
jgi:hypothetical protein